LQHDYEMLLMLDPELSEDRQEQIVVRTRELVEQSGGTWVGHDPWGRRRLAYPIDKKTDGIYHLVQFDADPDTLDELTRVLKITDGVMRQMPTRRVKGSHGPGRPGPEPPIDADRTHGYAGANVRSQEAPEAEAVGAAEQASDAGESPAADEGPAVEQEAAETPAAEAPAAEVDAPEAEPAEVEAAEVEPAEVEPAEVEAAEQSSEEEE
jgi:small subunit ribosomal protein S6